MDSKIYPKFEEKIFKKYKETVESEFECIKSKIEDLIEKNYKNGKLEYLEINRKMREEICNYCKAKINKIASTLKDNIREISQDMKKWFEDQLLNTPELDTEMKKMDLSCEKTMTELFEKKINHTTELILKYPRLIRFESIDQDIKKDPLFIQTIDSVKEYKKNERVKTSKRIISIITNRKYNPTSDYSFGELNVSEDSTTIKQIKLEIEGDFKLFEKMLINPLYYDSIDYYFKIYKEELKQLLDNNTSLKYKIIQKKINEDEKIKRVNVQNEN